MSDFFPASNYPGIFSAPPWIDAWEDAWSDCDAITQVCPHLEINSCRNKFYQYKKKIAGINIVTLFPAGVSTPISASLRSEYFQLDGLTANKFLASTVGLAWDQLYIPDVLVTSSDYLEICTAARALKLGVLQRECSIAYAVQLQANDFAGYLKSLSGNTRLKLFNKRKKLYEIGDVTVRNLWPSITDFISILNKFHLERWGSPCYEGRNLKQIVSFLHRVSSSGGEPDLSVIYCNGIAISAVLDVTFRKRIYNIQSGYLEKFQNGISLGTLHFGFQLEKAFNSNAEFYDFMAGDGKKSNYKQSLATHNEYFFSLMIVRNPILTVLYFIKDKLNVLKKGTWF